MRCTRAIRAVLQQVAFVIRVTVRVAVLAESMTAEVERDYRRQERNWRTRSQYPALQDVGVAYCVTDTRTEYRSQGSSSSGLFSCTTPAIRRSSASEG